MTDTADLEKRLRERERLYTEIASEHGGDKAALYRDVARDFREAADALADLTKRADALESLCDAFARNFIQRDYPCSPHCAGYLRERAAQLGVGISRADADVVTDQGEK